MEGTKGGACGESGGGSGGGSGGESGSGSGSGSGRQGGRARWRGESARARRADTAQWFMQAAPAQRWALRRGQEGRGAVPAGAGSETSQARAAVGLPCASIDSPFGRASCAAQERTGLGLFTRLPPRQRERSVERPPRGGAGGVGYREAPCVPDQCKEGPSTRRPSFLQSSPLPCPSEAVIACLLELLVQLSMFVSRATVGGGGRPARKSDSERRSQVIQTEAKWRDPIARQVIAHHAPGRSQPHPFCAPQFVHL